MIATEWNEFRNPDFEIMARLLRQPVIFDGRNVFDPARMAALGFTYHGMGRRRPPPVMPAMLRGDVNAPEGGGRGGLIPVPARVVAGLLGPASAAPAHLSSSAGVVSRGRGTATPTLAVTEIWRRLNHVEPADPRESLGQPQRRAISQSGATTANSSPP